MFINDVLDFILVYWKDLCYLLGFIILLVIGLIKKKTIINLNQLDAIKEDVLEVLPSLINAVECAGNGQAKLNAVLIEVKRYIFKKYGVKSVDDLTSWLVDSIENILSTPQKKGENDG